MAVHMHVLADPPGNWEELAGAAQAPALEVPRFHRVTVEPVDPLGDRLVYRVIIEYANRPETEVLHVTPDQIRPLLQAAHEARNTTGALAWEAVARAVQQLQEAQTQREGAVSRAEELLRSFLEPQQIWDLAHRGQFHVVSQHRHHYVLLQGHTQNILRVDAEGRPWKVYCAVSQEPVPPADQLLMQYLMLRYREDDFLQVARAWDYDTEFAIPRHTGEARIEMAQMPCVAPPEMVSPWEAQQHAMEAEVAERMRETMQGRFQVLAEALHEAGRAVIDSLW